MPRSLRASAARSRIGLQQQRHLTSGHPRLSYPTKEELLSSSSERLRGTLATALADGPIEIGVVGDVDVDAVVEEAAQTFGARSDRSTSWRGRLCK
jgi:zinc protease